MLARKSVPHKGKPQGDTARKRLGKLMDIYGPGKARDDSYTTPTARETALSHANPSRAQVEYMEYFKLFGKDKDLHDLAHTYFEKCSETNEAMRTKKDARHKAERHRKESARRGKKLQKVCATLPLKE
mmetsp:Transcript_2399/g.6018  ORF Transcript_2399/g.6018 Transcript_2399/m.6018 type:complete len:128 (-) Transcript_2399:71-454(-)|eukprot:jgi/Tetstr1/442279/TSEL_030420.t1